MTPPNNDHQASAPTTKSKGRGNLPTPSQSTINKSNDDQLRERIVVACFGEPTNEAIWQYHSKQGYCEAMSRSSSYLAVKALIRQEKLDLLERVKSEVIGENITHWTDRWGETHNVLEEGHRIENALREEQNEALEAIRKEIL